MKQPKFKFGDKVILKLTDKIEEVEGLRLKKNLSEWQYYIDSFAFGWTDESLLEPYVEPKKKKLYAYSENITIFDGVNSYVRIIFINKNNINLPRLPEYDIEYPEVDLKHNSKADL